MRARRNYLVGHKKPCSITQTSYLWHLSSSSRDYYFESLNIQLIILIPRSNDWISYMLIETSLYVLPRFGTVSRGMLNIVPTLVTGSQFLTKIIFSNIIFFIVTNN